MDYPKLRYVDAFPVETENGQMFALRDPSGISTETLIMSPNVFYLLQFLDGRHSMTDLQAEYTRALGASLPEEQLQSILDNLNEHLFLDNGHYTNRINKIEKDFLENPLRPAVHAGQSYEAEPKKLAEQMRTFFESPTGAGTPNSSNGKLLKGLVAPHIDIRAGGACYSHAYKALAESKGADCFVILGTGHAGLSELYSVISKDFATPFGAAKCDHDFIEKLTRNYPKIANSEILPHKLEHVIEFQVVFLKYLYDHIYKDGRDFTFVPLLCSFSHHALTDSRFSREKDIVEEFSRALKKTISEFGKQVCVISSVDFCHVGMRYGDEFRPDETLIKNMKAFDHNMIKSIENLDANTFCDIIASSDDRYRVCGFSSIYTMLKAMEAEQGQLLDYAKTEVDDQNSIVTFASMSFQ